MDAVEFIKEYQRMCEKESCHNCPAFGNNVLSDCDLCTKSPEKLVQIVEQWSQDHPQKTMMQDFFEKFPNAPKHKNGCPKTCPNNIYNCKPICTNECVKCWSRPLED